MRQKIPFGSFVHKRVFVSSCKVGSLSPALRKLDVLAAAHELVDLRLPPGSRLEALKGDLEGFHSIRINDQWRIVFRWENGGADQVAIID